MSMTSDPVSSACLQVIKTNGGKESATEYFGVLVS